MTVYTQGRVTSVSPLQQPLRSSWSPSPIWTAVAQARAARGDSEGAAQARRKRACRPCSQGGEPMSRRHYVMIAAVIRERYFHYDEGGAMRAAIESLAEDLADSFRADNER